MRTSPLSPCRRFGRGSLHSVYLRVFSVKFQFVNNAVFTALVQHLNRNAAKDISASLAELSEKAFASIAVGEPMVRLILDFRIKAVGLHLCHHTGQPNDVGVVFVSCRFEFRAEFNIPFQLGKVLNAMGCGGFALSVISSSPFRNIPPAAVKRRSRHPRCCHNVRQGNFHPVPCAS